MENKVKKHFVPIKQKERQRKAKPGRPWDQKAGSGEYNLAEAWMEGYKRRNP